MADQTRRNLAAEIRAVREARKWTQEELAENLGVTGATVSRWEAGLSIPKPDHLRRLSLLVRPADGITGKFFTRYRNMTERARITESVERAAGVRERAQLGEYTVSLLEDGSLLIRAEQNRR